MPLFGILKNSFSSILPFPQFQLFVGINLKKKQWCLCSVFVLRVRDVCETAGQAICGGSLEEVAKAHLPDDEWKSH